MKTPPNDDPAGLLGQVSWLRRLARTLVTDAASADDLVQETWLQALAHPPRRSGSLRPWLARVMQNQFLQHKRSSARRASREQDRVQPEPLPSPDQVVERLDAQRALLHCVYALAEPYQSSIVLHFYEGLSAAEIARRSDTPPATVRSRIARGLDQLREKLDAQHQGKREAWVLLFVPLTHWKRPALLASGAGLIKGLVLMSSTMKLILGGGLLAAASLGLGWAVQQLAAEQELQRPAANSVAQEAPNETQTLASEPPAPTTNVPERSALSSLTEPKTVLAKLGPGPLLQAKVLDEDQRPIAGASARLFSFKHADLPSAKSDAEGQLSLGLDSAVAPGKFRLLVSADHYVSKRLFFEWDPGQDLELDLIILKRGQALRGWVQTAEGTPAENTEIGITRITSGFQGLPQAELNGPGWLGKEVLAKSDAFGFFELENVEPGLLWIWAKDQDSLWSYSDSLELKPNVPQADLALLLKPIPPKHFVSGRVVDPGGAGLAEIQLECSTARGRFLYEESDATGEFKLLLDQDVLYQLRVSDPEGRWTHITREIKAGEHIELRFLPTRKLTFSVLDENQRVLEKQFVVIKADTPDEAPITWAATSAADAEGKSEVSLLEPAESFLVCVERDGYRDLQSGPHAPGQLGAETKLHLEPLPGLFGRVLHEEHGVAGVRVTLNKYLDAQSGSYTLSYHKGFFSYVAQHGAISTTTDSDGYFTHYPKEKGSYVLRAERDGLAPAELTLPGIDPLAGELDAELQLSLGGTIEGRVLVGPGESALGKLVAVSRGDLHPRMLRVEADGRFRFEHLMPGRWNVELIVDDLGRHYNSFASSTTKPEAPWVCEVREGATTKHDLDVSLGSLARVFGSLVVDGRPAAGWSVDGRASNHMSGRESSRPSTLLDEHGRFELPLPVTGSFLMTLRSQSAQLPLELTRSWSLEAGDNEFHGQLSTGTLELSGLPEESAPGSTWHLSWSGEDGLHGEMQFTPEADGSCTIPGIPAGSVEISRRAPGARALLLHRAEMLEQELCRIRIP